MRYYIKEWPDHKASLIAEDGYELEVFNSVGEAVSVCKTDCLVEPEYIDCHFKYLTTSLIKSGNTYLH